MLCLDIQNQLIWDADAAIGEKTHWQYSGPQLQSVTYSSSSPTALLPISLPFPRAPTYPPPLSSEDRVDGVSEGTPTLAVCRSRQKSLAVGSCRCFLEVRDPFSNPPTSFFFFFFFIPPPLSSFFVCVCHESRVWLIALSLHCAPNAVLKSQLSRDVVLVYFSKECLFEKRI